MLGFVFCIYECLPNIKSDFRLHVLNNSTLKDESLVYPSVLVKDRDRDRDQLHFILLWYFVVFFQTVIHFAIWDLMSQRNSIYIYSQASRPGPTQPTLLAALKLIELASEIS